MSVIPTVARTIAASRIEAAVRSSPGRGKCQARFHRPASTKTAPAACAPAWNGVRRTGAQPAPRSSPAKTPIETGA